MKSAGEQAMSNESFSRRVDKVQLRDDAKFPSKVKTVSLGRNKAKRDKETQRKLRVALVQMQARKRGDLK